VGSEEEPEPRNWASQTTCRFRHPVLAGELVEMAPLPSRASVTGHDMVILRSAWTKRWPTFSGETLRLADRHGVLYLTHDDADTGLDVR
jgi:hypothetical protein